MKDEYKIMKAALRIVKCRNNNTVPSKFTFKQLMEKLNND